MSKDLDLNIRLKADATGFKGAVNTSQQELEKLAKTTHRQRDAFGRFVKSSGQAKDGLDGLNGALKDNATTSGQTRRGLERLQGGMVGVRDSMNLINGPLNGISGRFTALTSILNKNNLAWVGVGLGVGTAGFALQQGLSIAMNAERQQLRLEAVLKATGHSVGFTAQQLEAFAQKTALATLASTTGVRKAMGVLLTFKTVTGQRFKEAIALSQDMAEVMGSDISSAAMQMGKALEDPANGLAALTRNGVSFSESEKDLIKSLSAVGKTAEAQSLILDKVAGQMGGAATKAAEGLAGKVDTLGHRWEEFLRAVGKTPAVIKVAGGSLDFLSETLERMTPGQNRQLAALKAQRQALVAELEQLEKIRMRGYQVGDSVGDWWESVVQGDESIDGFFTGLTGKASQKTEERWLALQKRIGAVNAEIERFRRQQESLEKPRNSQAAPVVPATPAWATRYNRTYKEENDQPRVEAEQALSRASIKATQTQVTIKEQLRKKAAADHERSIRRIKQAQISLMTGYDQAEARAKQWRDETKAGLDATAANYNTLAAQVDHVFDQKMIKAQEKHLRSSRHWSTGVKKAMRSYVEEAGFTSRNMERVTANALGSMEDAFVRFFTTGKFGTREMVNSILADLARLAVQRTITQPLFTTISGMFEPTSTRVPEMMDIPARAAGGPVGAGRMYEVVEEGPELLSLGGRHYLMMGNQSGHVTPISGNPGGSAISGGGASGPVNPGLTIKPTVYIRAPGVTARTEGGFNPAGEFKLDVIIEQIEETMGRRIAKGQGLADVMENKYGLNPAMGAVT